MSSCALGLDCIPQKARDIGTAEALDLADAGRRGNVDLGEIIADHVDADEKEATFAQGGADAVADFLLAFRQFRMLGAPADMHVGPAVVLGRHAVDRADRLAIDQDDALVALADIGQVLLRNEGLPEHQAEGFEQRGEIAVVLLEMEDASATVAVKRLDDDVAHLFAEGADFGRIAGNERRRHQVRKLRDEDLFRRIAHPSRIVDDERLRVDALQHVGRRDIGHVEWRVLTEQNDIHGRQVDALRRTEGEVVALGVAQLHRFGSGIDLAVTQRQSLGRIMEKPVAPRLRLQAHGESRIACDVDGRDMVHLDRDIPDLCHVISLSMSGKSGNGFWSGHALTGLYDAPDI